MKKIITGLLLLICAVLFCSCKKNDLNTSQTQTVNPTEYVTEHPTPERTRTQRPTPMPTATPTQEPTPIPAPDFTRFKFIPSFGLKNPVNGVLSENEITEVLDFTMEASLLMNDIREKMYKDGYDSKPFYPDTENPENEYYFYKGQYAAFNALMADTSHYFTEDAMKKYLLEANGSVIIVYDGKLAELNASGGGWFIEADTPQVAYAFSKTCVVVDFIAEEDVTGFSEVYYKVEKKNGTWVITGVKDAALLDENYQRKIINEG